MAALFLTSCQALQANILFAPDFATDGKKKSAAAAAKGIIVMHRILKPYWQLKYPRAETAL
jgi:hypothetical protein